MSHTTTVKDVRVHDPEALRLAVEALRNTTGLDIQLAENAPCRLWFEKPVCDLVVSVAGCRFDVGFRKAADGVGLEPIFDAHGGELYRMLGQGREEASTAEERNLSNIGKLLQHYTMMALHNEALRQGATVSGSMNTAGQYVMVAH